MTIMQNNADGGSNGVAVLSDGSNTGGASGTAFASCVFTTAGAVTFSNAYADTGSLSYRFAAGNNTELQYLRWTPTASRVGAFRAYFNFPTLPTAGNAIVAIKSSGGGTTHLLVVIRNDGSYQVSDAGGGFPYTSPASVIPAATGLRLEFGITNPSSTTGTLSLDWYVGDSTTPLHTMPPITTGNFAATAMAQVWVGRVSAFGNFASFNVDSVAWNDSSNTYIGPSVNTPPTVDAGVNQNVGAAATVNLTATVSDAETSATVVWTFDYPTSGAPSLTGGTTLTPSFTSGSLGALYILRCTATDTDGVSSFDTMEVRVPVAGATSQRMVPINGSGTGTWTNVGSAATEGAALSDESDATYLESPSVSAVEATRRLRWIPSSAKATANVVEKLWTDTGTANCTVRLYEGATLRQSWAQALNTTPTQYSFTLSGATITAITDWGGLYVEVGVTT